MKRFVSLLMIAAVILSTVTAVCATKEDYYVYVNPIYSHVMTDKDIISNSMQAYDVMAAEEPEYLSYEDAVKKLREQLTERKETCHVYIRSETKLGDEFYRDVLYDVMEHTGIPTQGDYMYHSAYPPKDFRQHRKEF